VRYGADTTLRVARGLFAFALVSLTANLWLGGLQGVGTLVFGLVALAAIGNVWRSTPNPRGILLQGAMAIGVGVAAHVAGAVFV